MDQHEQDWLRLGEGLRNYQPAGDPAADFAKLQELQRASKRPSRVALLLLGLFFLLFSAGVLFWLLGEPAVDSKSAVVASITTEERDGNTTGNDLASTIDEASLATMALSDEKDQALNALHLPPPVKQPKRITIPTTIDVTLPDPEPSLLPVPDAQPLEQEVTISMPLVVSVSSISVDKASVAVDRELPQVVVTVPYSTPATIKAVKTMPRLSFGGGLSTHWRGNQFLSDPDLGVYASLGIQQRIGERFFLSGRVGYRGHNLNLQILEDDKPWSHYEEKINRIEDNGQEVEYTYLGIVDGYKGIEFSLLLQYQLTNKATIQAGGRYSLPALSFRRTVHSSLHGDVTAQPNPYQFFTTEQPLVKYFDYGALLGGEYRLSDALSVEAQLHFGMVDLIEDAGERMERFNHSSSLSLGLRYRLN